MRRPKAETRTEVSRVHDTTAQFLDENSMSFNLLHFNGIDANTGNYLLSLSEKELAAVAGGFKLSDAHKRDLRLRSERTAKIAARTLGVAEGVDDKDLASCGWGVIFPAALEAETLAALKEALQPLLTLRRQQAGEFYFEFAGEKGYQPNEEKAAFLERQGASSVNAADPQFGVPYYVLLVGDPEQISYRFQYELDVIYSVGRLHFATLAEYDNYARSVVAAETGEFQLRPRAAFFGVQNDDDEPTHLSATRLVAPLAQNLALPAAKLPQKWEIETHIGEGASKEKLGEIINGAAPPALLFTASHGLGFTKGHKKQVAHQGALLCQNWPGPENHSGPIPEDYYFAGDDVSQNANLGGTIAFHFACYGGGTPKFDEFNKQAFTSPKPIADKAFMANLPRQLLNRPRGGALAVVAHIERAWGYSFLSRTPAAANNNAELTSFDSMLKRLMKGQPLGVALEFFNNRYAALATELTGYLQAAEQDTAKGSAADQEFKLAELWTAQNDARGYAIIGDPAVKLNVNAKLKEDERPVLTLAGDAPPPQSVTAENPAPAAAFGLLDTLKGAGEQTNRRLQETLEKLNAWLECALDDATGSEVATYASDDMGQVTHEAKGFTNAQLRALTRISLSGDLASCVPAKKGELDDKLWRVHDDMVAQALQHRTENLKAVAEVLAQLLAVVKPLP